MVTDGFHPTNEFYPIDPLPKINNHCSDPAACPTLNFTTATEAYYLSDSKRAADTGYDFNSAQELRAKLSSR